MNFTAIKIRCLQCSFFLFLLLASQSLNAAIIYVDGGLTGGDGLSWATAYGDLQTGINAANFGDEVWVKNGTYLPHDTDREISFTLKNGVALLGGFTGSGANRDKINTASVLSGAIGPNPDNSDNSYNVVFCQGLSPATILEGFIIQDGNADGATPLTRNGGGLYNDGSSLTIRHVQFFQNQANEFGGAINNGGNASPLIEYCTFSGNYAGNQGGAINNDGGFANSSPTIFQSTFISNSALFGGAIYNSGNSGTSNPTITSCDFSSNSAVGGGSNGGAIYNFGKDGGSSMPTITNCIFNNNASSSSASGIYSLADAGTVIASIVNCTFYQNSAPKGGAVYVNESNGGNGESNITNSIFEGNSGGMNPTFNLSGNASPTINVSFSLVDAVDCDGIMGTIAGGQIFSCDGVSMVFNLNPTFVSAGSDFRLMSTSPAINKGGAATVSTDKDELPRTVASVVDLGAYENQSPILPIELLAFDARFENDQVALYWSTLSEKSNDYFTIERSQDGQHFTAIERISGAGDSDIPLTYRTFDPHPRSGINYYRLKQTDYNGNFSYSHIEAIKIQDGNIRLYPNPVTDHLYIATNGFENGETKYSIFNLNGKEVINGIIELHDNLAVLQVNEIQSLPPGSYFVKIFHERNGGFSQKFVKVRR